MIIITIIILTDDKSDYEDVDDFANNNNNNNNNNNIEYGVMVLIRIFIVYPYNLHTVLCCVCSMLKATL
jgi:hypothetical protein